MAFDFGFSLYFLDPPNLTVLEQFFVQVQGKINIYKTHAQTTIELYQSEAREKLAANTAEFKAAMVEAEAIYKRVFDETAGSEQDRHGLASHESGEQEITHHYTTYEESLKEGFMEMADHYNKSSVVTLYALLETELRRLCGHLHSSFGLRFTVERFEKTDYLKSMMEYISLVADMDITAVEPKMTKLTELQFLRNKIMHNGAEFSLEHHQWLEDMVNASDNGLVWEQIPEEQLRVLRVKSKFITPFYGLISEFFYELFASLNAKLTFGIFSDRIKFLFGFLTKETTAKYVTHRDVANGEQFVFLIESADFDNLFAFNCKLTITTAAADQVVITNQLDEIIGMERWVAQMAENPPVLRQALVGYLAPNKAHKIEIMLYLQN